VMSQLRAASRLPSAYGYSKDLGAAGRGSCLNEPMPNAGKVSIARGTLHHVERQVLDLSAAICSF
jgi:hypothetical protein